MHTFKELAYRCTYFSLSAISEAYEENVKILDETGSTPPVKNLQALNLQKMVHAVGLFSIFEAHLQQSLNCSNGYTEALSILQKAGEISLKNEFHNYYLAINALKHGDGVSYRRLVTKASIISFLVDTPSTPVCEEGDVSGVSGLVRVDDNFIEGCLQVIVKVSECISKHRPDYAG